MRMSTRRHCGTVNGGLTGAATLPSLRAALGVEPRALPIRNEGDCTGVARCCGSPVKQARAAARSPAGRKLRRIAVEHCAVARRLVVGRGRRGRDMKFRSRNLADPLTAGRAKVVARRRWKWLRRGAVAGLVIVVVAGLAAARSHVDPRRRAGRRRVDCGQRDRAGAHRARPRQVSRCRRRGRAARRGRERGHLAVDEPGAQPPSSAPCPGQGADRDLRQGGPVRAPALRSPGRAARPAGDHAQGTGGARAQRLRRAALSRARARGSPAQRGRDPGRSPHPREQARRPGPRPERRRALRSPNRGVPGLARDDGALHAARTQGRDPHALPGTAGRGGRGQAAAVRDLQPERRLRPRLFPSGRRGTHRAGKDRDHHLAERRGVVCRPGRRRPPGAARPAAHHVTLLLAG